MAGIINPHGRIHLNETARDLTPKEKTSNANQKSARSRVKPFANITSKADLEAIKQEIRRLYVKEKRKKSVILLLLRDELDFNKVESENIFFYTFRRKR